MRKSFEEVLGLSADDFAMYFNSRVLEALGRAGAGASLTAVERKRIEEIRCDLYEKLREAKKHNITVKEIYFALEEAHIEAAKVALQSGLDAARVTEAGAAAATLVSEFPDLAHLSGDPLRGITSYLLPQGKGRLAAASKALHTELKSDLKRSKFLLHVARGQQSEAEAMLRVDRSLLTQSGEFTDYSGRRFICSAYEYAYWAKDTHMCRMLGTHMDEEAKALLRKRIERMEEIDPVTGQARGLVYWQNHVKHQSAHFDLAPLITALQAYVNGVDAWDRDANWDAMEAAWLKVGLAQREVPAHVAQEYCRPDRSFHPTPSFTEATLPRVLAFYNNPTGSEDFWFPLVSPSFELGFDFSLACVRGETEPAWVPWMVVCGEEVVDLAALRRLDEVRTADLRLSRDHLNPAATSPRLGR